MTTINTETMGSIDIEDDIFYNISTLLNDKQCYSVSDKLENTSSLILVWNEDGTPCFINTDSRVKGE